MVWFSFVLYVIVGMAGYFLFGEDCSGSAADPPPTQPPHYF